MCASVVEHESGLGYYESSAAGGVLPLRADQLRQGGAGATWYVWQVALEPLDASSPPPSRSLCCRVPCRYSGENKGGVGTVVGVGKDGKQGPGEYSVMYDAQGNPLEYM